jgi:outer membrane protein OmpA-like peptidoglycan-associated protein
MNVRLSRDRAAAVVRYLVTKGIAPARLESEGYGPDRPIDTNETEEGRAKNRRVEFKIQEEIKK